MCTNIISSSLIEGPRPGIPSQNLEKRAARLLMLRRRAASGERGREERGRGEREIYFPWA